ncbi:MAG: PKD domain-containing protein, partial [Bacteroidota bacterium]
ANVAAGGGGAGNIVRGLLNNSCRGNFPGRPGRGLTVDDERLYFGGGGGAGHANNTNMASGGNGGGLVVLWSPKITFTGSGAIDVSGIAAAEVDGDGGGGGGAGGSILLVADSLKGSPSLNLSGGRGADVDNPSDRCFGPGGGGGGGRLIIAAISQVNFSPTVMLAPGGPGQRLNSNECSPDEEPAGSGSAGSRRDLTPNVPFGGFSLSTNLLCGGEELTVTDNSAGADVVNWEILPTNTGITVQSDDQGLIISLADTVNGNFQVIQSLELNGTTYLGDTLAFNVAPIALADSASIVLASETVTASVFAPRGFSSIQYDFGDGTVVNSSATSQEHTYQEGGSYTVSITLLNPSCGAQQVQESTFEIGAFAQPLIVTKSAVGCTPLELTLTEQSTGTFGGIRWDCPGGSPSTSTERSPTITYTDTGQFVVTLTLLDAIGNDTVTSIPVVVRESPMADFSTAIDTATAIFTATSPNATSYRWEFGDGNDSEEMNPVHTYDSTGTYTVVLIASRNTCSVRIEREITIGVLSDVYDLQTLGVKLFPNPTTGRLQLTGPAEIIGAFDLRGRIIPTSSTREIDLSRLPAGPYLIRVKANERVFNVRILKN